MLEKVTLVVDIDGTLCPIKGKEEAYADISPYQDVLLKIREYKALGAKIVLYTSRNVNTYQGNIGLINANTAKILLAWLDKWDVPYDEIIYGKPWPGPHGFYVDDRSVPPDQYLRYSFEELAAICENSRKELR